MKLYKFARRLYNQGHFKLAHKIISADAREDAIWKQHMQDQEDMRDKHPGEYSETKPPVDLPPEMLNGPSERRYEVQVVYPSFNDEGKPYFDDNSVQESLTMTQNELQNHKKQEQSGYLKILSVEPKIPTSSPSTRALH